MSDSDTFTLCIVVLCVVLFALNWQVDNLRRRIERLEDRHRPATPEEFDRAVKRSDVRPR